MFDRMLVGSIYDRSRGVGLAVQGISCATPGSGGQRRLADADGSRRGPWDYWAVQGQANVNNMRAFGRKGIAASSCSWHALH